jgi:hypothetical protein
MSIKSLILFILLWPLTAFGQEIRSAGQINWGGDCRTEYKYGAIRLTGFNVAGADQGEMSLCGNQAYTTFVGATTNADNLCIVPFGNRVTIKDIWYLVNEILVASTEQCKIGLSIDVVGAEPFDYQTWSTIDVGDLTSGGQTNCDELRDVNSDGSLDGTGDACHVSDPVGAVMIKTASGRVGWRILIDEADSGTPVCTTLRSVAFVVKVETCEVPF